MPIIKTIANDIGCFFIGHILGHSVPYCDISFTDSINFDLSGYIYCRIIGLYGDNDVQWPYCPPLKSTLMHLTVGAIINFCIFFCKIICYTGNIERYLWEDIYKCRYRERHDLSGYKYLINNSKFSKCINWKV